MGGRLTDADKTPYNAQAKKNGEIYKQKMQTYDPSVWEARMKADPKPNPSAYSIYVKNQYASVYARLGKGKSKEVMKELGRQWKALDSSQQEPLKREASEKYVAWKHRNGLH